MHLHCLPSRRLRNWFVLAAALLLVSMPSRLRASDNQELDEYQIKAGYLFNFLRFVEWPEKSFATPSSPIILCVVGDTPITGYVTEAAAGKPIGGRLINVHHPRVNDDLHSCHLLFVNATEARNTDRILESVKSSNTLTVGEVPGFTRSGGIITFFDEDNKVRLEINPDAATRANLKISARLLAVSRIVTAKSKGGD